MYLSLSSKKIPILALWGKQDGVVPYKGSKEYKNIFPEGSFISLEEGTHDITYRQPTIVGQEIIKFIDSV
jgi:pimeloyl-ACP methyl ester carboxylesterase